MSRDLDMARRAYESDRENELYQQEYLRQLRLAGLDVQYDRIKIEIGRVEDLKSIREVADKLRYLAFNREAALQAARFIVQAELTPEDEALYERFERYYYEFPPSMPHLSMSIISHVLNLGAFGVGRPRARTIAGGAVQALYLPLPSYHADTVVYFHETPFSPYDNVQSEHFEIMSLSDLQDIVLESRQHAGNEGLTGPTEWYDILERGRPYYREIV